jgi:hypothetical protein
MAIVEHKVKITFPNGDVYEGDPLVNDKLNGFGMHTSVKTGCSYKGIWKHHELISGVITKPNYIYIGEVRKFQPHGRGSLTRILADNIVTTEDGKFTNGVLVAGKHTTTQYDDVVIYEGVFAHDHLVGKGKKTFYNKTRRIIQEGFFLGGAMHGNGRTIEVNNNVSVVCTGEFRNGMLHGNGTVLHLVNGLIVKFTGGEFINNKLVCSDIDEENKKAVKPINCVMGIVINDDN